MATKLIQAPPGTSEWFLDEVSRAERAGPTMHVIDLTPELAKTIYEINLDNRSGRNVKVAQYAADMAAGNWAMNGEPIIISRCGNLNDGQHRCLAVIESNSTIPTAIMFGVERETRLTVDQGGMRSASDFLAMEGVPNAALSAAIARMVIAFEDSGGVNLSGTGRVTSAEIRQRVATDLNIAASAKFGGTNAHHSRVFAGGSLVGFVHYIFSRVDRHEAEVFLLGVCRGEGLRARDPAHTLREKLIAAGKTGRDRKIKLFIQAWNFHRRGMKVAANSMSDKLPFPALM